MFILNLCDVVHTIARNSILSEKHRHHVDEVLSAVEEIGLVVEAVVEKVEEVVEEVELVVEELVYFSSLIKLLFTSSGW